MTHPIPETIRLRCKEWAGLGGAVTSLTENEIAAARGEK